MPIDIHPISPSTPSGVSAVLALASRLDSSGRRLIENRHQGWAVVRDAAGRVLYCTPGARDAATFFRSAAKPFQAYPLVTSGLYKTLSPEQLAIACASHSGSARHLDLAASLLERAGLTEAALHCGPHPPLDPVMQQELTHKGQPPTALCNNCSGKHAGMLLVCRHHGWPTESYLDPDHPLQQEILAALRKVGDQAEIPVGMDGCGAPVFYLPLITMALLYARLGKEEDFAPIMQAMTRHPVIVGGEGRIDTVLMQASEGRLLAKVGADGLICVSRIAHGEGLALKIADGSNEARNAVIIPLLQKLGWLEDQMLAHPALEPYSPIRRINTQNKLIGYLQVHLPGLEG